VCDVWVWKHTIREIGTAENEWPRPTPLIVEVRNPVSGADEGQIPVISIDVVVVGDFFLETVGPRDVTLWPLTVVEEKMAGNIRTAMQGPDVRLDGEVVHNLMQNVQLGTHGAHHGTL
jgi:hypothetical protein